MIDESEVEAKIEEYERKAHLAYERGWFKEQEQYICAVQALNELL